jgi:hypothetical protein
MSFYLKVISKLYVLPGLQFKKFPTQRPGGNFFLKKKGANRFVTFTKNAQHRFYGQPGTFVKKKSANRLVGPYLPVPYCNIADPAKRLFADYSKVHLVH